MPYVTLTYGWMDDANGDDDDDDDHVTVCIMKQVFKCY